MMGPANDIPFTISGADTSDVDTGRDAYVQWGDQLLAFQVKQHHGPRGYPGLISYSSTMLTNALSSAASLGTIQNRSAWSHLNVTINLADSLKRSPNFVWASSLSDPNFTWSPSAQWSWTSLLDPSAGVATGVREPRSTLTVPLSTPFAQTRSRERATRRVTGMQKWEGRVLEVDDNTFSAELDPFDHTGPAVIADFDIELLSEQIGVVQAGDLFYLTVCTILDRGRPVRTSVLRPRRLGKWTADELRAIAARTDRRLQFLDGYVD
jgi:hypothetical protein